MIIKGKSAVITGAGSGIGQAVAVELAERGIGGSAWSTAATASINVARMINDRMDRPIAEAIIGDVTDAAFRTEGLRPDVQQVRRAEPSASRPPASPATSSRVKVDKQTGKAVDLPDRELPAGHGGQPRRAGLLGDRDDRPDRRGAASRRARAAGTAEEGIQGTIIFIGSISSHGQHRPGRLLGHQGGARRGRGHACARRPCTTASAAP